MDRVRLGLIGAGSVARNRHLPALAGIPEALVLKTWSRRAENARQVAAELEIPEVMPEWEELVQSPDLDGVVIATPPVIHLPATLAALAAGKHVLCQARMARNLEEALEMADAAAASGLIAGLSPPLPGLKGDRVMKRLMSRGRFRWRGARGVGHRHAAFRAPTPLSVASRPSSGRS